MSWDDENLALLIRSRFLVANQDSVEAEKLVHNTPESITRLKTFHSQLPEFQQLETYSKMSTLNGNFESNPINDKGVYSRVFHPVPETIYFPKWKQESVLKYPTRSRISRYYLHYHLAQVACQSLIQADQVAGQELKDLQTRLNE